MSVVTLPDRFVQFLHNLNFKRRHVSKELLGLRVFYVDLSPLRLRFSDRSPVIEVPRQETQKRSPEEILGTIKDIVLQLQVQARMPIILLEGRSAELRRLANEPPYYMVVLDEEDMTQVIGSRSPSDELLARIRYQVPLSFLSPYEVSAPVTGSQFFGRDYEIRTMLSHPDTCYTILGTRRIGKTSVLREVQRRIEAAESEEVRRFLYYDCMAFTGKQAFFERVISSLYSKEYNRLWRMGEGYLGYFPQFMQRMKAMYKGTIVFFLDEIDNVLWFDRERSYELIRTFRACFQEGSCRFIFSGSREAQRELAKRDSPFNFSTDLILGSFTYDQAAEVVGVPMNNLGVKLVSRDQVIRRICWETAGHPNLIQHYCLALTRQLDETGTREIAPEHLTKLVEDESFRVRVLETFVFNTNDLEKAVAYAVADREHFSIEDVDRQMKRRRLLLTIWELEDACRKLEALGVVEQVGQVFRFTIPVFPQLLRERYGGEFLFAKANEYRKLRIKRGEHL
jgi:hypothetical protein